MSDEIMPAYTEPRVADVVAARSNVYAGLQSGDVMTVERVVRNGEIVQCRRRVDGAIFTVRCQDVMLITAAEKPEAIPEPPAPPPPEPLLFGMFSKREVFGLVALHAALSRGDDQQFSISHVRQHCRAMADAALEGLK
jgi:hypothetical protein